MHGNGPAAVGPADAAAVGLAYLQRYGGHVRAAVLDSGSLLNVPEQQLDASHAQRAFDQLASRCAATPACARSYHPAADLAAVLARLTAHPVRVSLPGAGGRLLAATTAFIQAGLPASPASWNACTRALAHEPEPFPAP